MKKILVLLFMCISCSFLFAVESGDSVDPDLAEYVSNLNDEDYIKESAIINDLYNELFNLENKSEVDLSEYVERLTPYDDDFKDASLTEKLRIIQANAKVKDDMTDKILESYKNDLVNGQKAFSIMREIIFHENIISEIIEKIAKTSNDYTMAAQDLLKDTQIQLNSAIEKLNIAETNAKLLNEALAYQERKNKNAYIAGNIIIPVVGLPFIFTGAMLVANSNEDSLVSPDFANALLYSGIAITVGCELVWNGGHLIFKWW